MNFYEFFFGSDPLYCLSIVPAIIGAVGVLGGAVASGLFSKSQTDKNTRKQHEYNLQYIDMQQENQKELAALQEEYAVKNWQMENEYNTPLAQRERLLRAGINPNFVDAITSGVAGAIATPSQGSAPSVSPPDVAAASNAATQRGQFISDSIQGAANIGKTIAETKNLNADTDAKSIQNKYLDDLYRGQLELNNVTVSLNTALGYKTDAEIMNIFQQTRNLETTFDLINTNIKSINQSIAESIQNVEESKARVDLLKAQKTTTEIQGNLFEAEATYQYEQSETARVLRPLQAQFTESQTRLNDKNCELADVQKAFTVAQTYESQAKTQLYKAQTETEKANCQLALANAHWLKIQATYHPQNIRATVKYLNSSAKLNDEQARVATETAEFIASQALNQQLVNGAMQQEIYIPVRDPRDNTYYYYRTNLINAQGVMKLQLDESGAWYQYQNGNYVQKQIEWFDFDKKFQAVQGTVNMVNSTFNTLMQAHNGGGMQIPLLGK